MSISDEDIARLLTEPGPPQPSHAITDLGNAERLIQRHGGDLLHVHPWSAWLHYDAGRWVTDTVGHAEKLAKQTTRELLIEATQIEDDRLRNRTLKEVIAAERSGRIRGMLDLARSEPGIPALPQDLDADPWLFNVANGTIDLRTGQLLDHQREHLITKQAPVAYNPNAEAPVWEKFLSRVLPDTDVRHFLPRVVGYSMTGLTTEQILLILYGSGANGKSTFLELIRALLGDYGQQAPPETFLERRDSIPNDVARLRGARFVAATEIAENRRLNEPLIKRMTGGDTMTARFMRSEYFEFQPQFTPWLATNHRPEIRGTDEAIWRRIRLIPFTVTIPEPERDPNLPQKLKDELPGILNWAIDGCLAWQADGLGTPEAVKNATNEYRGDMDLIGGFLEDACHLNPGSRERAADLYAAYQAHTKAGGNDPVTVQTFGRRLTERGFTKRTSRSGRQWEGIALKTDQTGLEI